LIDLRIEEWDDTEVPTMGGRKLVCSSKESNEEGGEEEIRLKPHTLTMAEGSCN